MAFIDENGNPTFNEEQKIRLTFSKRAKLTMSEDMAVFGVTKAATFINTVFDHFKYEAKSSISLYLQQREIELDRLFQDTPLDDAGKKTAVRRILLSEETELKNKISEYTASKGESKLYHINDENIRYLSEDCDEEKYYSRAGLYLRSVVEEYCTLPFIKRERIYRKDVYDIIERACQEKRILKVRTKYQGQETLFYVYPYKIVPDPLHTRSYLTCYSRRAEEDEKDKIVASFSMSRISTPTMLTKTFHLNKAEKDNIEAQLTQYSAAYLLGSPEEVKVRLTPFGRQAYQNRLHSRPPKEEALSTEDVYVFHCSQQQIMNYFFSFGADAEILSPESLREQFRRKHEKSLRQYQK